MKWRPEIKDDRQHGYYEISIVRVNTELKYPPHHAQSYGWEDFINKIILPKAYSKVDDAMWNKMVETAQLFADVLNKRDGYDGQTTYHSDSKDLVSSF